MATQVFTPTTTLRKAIIKKKSGPKGKAGVSQNKFEDPVLNRIYQQLVHYQCKLQQQAISSSSDADDIQITRHPIFANTFPVLDQDGNMLDPRVGEKRCELAVSHLKKGSLLSAKQRQTPKHQVFQEQLKIVEEKHKNDIGIMDDVQEFMRARAKFELEHAQNLQKLSQQFHNKRKWPPFTYTKGHDDILLVDLWRSVVNLSMEDAKSHAMASERLNFLANDLFDQHKDQKKQSFRTAMTVLEQLQDELFKLDSSVSETKQEYDAAMKGVDKAKSKKKSTEADVKRLESSCQFRRQEYLLELAAANQHYLHFRDQQLPEVMDAATGQHMEFFSEFFKAYATLFSATGSACFKNMQKVDKLSGRLDATLERRTFLHEHIKEFPGRTLFVMEQHASDKTSPELTANDENRHVLAKMRQLLQHSSDTITKTQKDKQKQMDALQKLYRNYMDASAMFDKQQPKLVEEKMAVLHLEIEIESLKRAHLEAKIASITAAGIQNNTLETTPKHGEVLDLKQAQERETVRRKAFAIPKDPDQQTVSLTPSSKQPKQTTGKDSSLKLDSNSSNSAPHPTPRGRKQDSKENNAVSTPTQAPNAARRPSLSDYGNIDTIRRDSQQKEDPYMCPATLKGSEEYSKVSPVTRRTTRRHESDDDDAPELPRRLPRATLEHPPPNIHLLDNISSNLPPPDIDIDSSDDEGFECLPPPPTDFEISILDSIPPPPELNETEMESFRDLPPPPSPDFGHSGTSVAVNLNRSSRIYEELVEAELPLLYKSLYNYEAINQDDIDLVQGEYVYVLVARDDGWCQGVNLTGSIGFFPASYVEREDDKVVARSITKPRLLWVFAGSGGFGMQIAGKSPVVVTQVIRGGAADKAGVKKEDVILEIDGESFADKDATVVTNRLAMAAATRDRRAKICVINSKSGKIHNMRQGIVRGSSGLSVV